MKDIFPMWKSTCRKNVNAAIHVWLHFAIYYMGGKLFHALTSQHIRIRTRAELKNESLFWRNIFGSVEKWSFPLVWWSFWKRLKKIFYSFLYIAPFCSPLLHFPSILHSLMRSSYSLCALLFTWIAHATNLGSHCFYSGITDVILYPKLTDFDASQCHLGHYMISSWNMGSPRWKT